MGQSMNGALGALAVVGAVAAAGAVMGRKGARNMSQAQAQEELGAYGELIAERLRNMYADKAEVAHKINMGEKAWKEWDVDNLFNSGLLDYREAERVDEILAKLRGGSMARGRTLRPSLNRSSSTAKTVKGSGRVPDYKPKQVVAWFKKMIRAKLMIHPEDDVFSDKRFTAAEAKAADKIIAQIFDDVGDNIWEKVDRAWADSETQED